MSKPRVIKARVGSYQGSDGTTKNRYIEVGKLIEGERGPYILLSKWFSPAGIETEAGRDSVILSIFDQKDFEDDTPDPAGKKSIPF
jgi:hypothetical protein